MKVKVIFCLIILFSITVKAQVEVIDSLNNELAKAKAIDKARLLNEISNRYKYSDPNQMAKYGTKALQFSQQNNYRIEAANAHLNIGTSNIILGNYKQALEDFSSAKLIFEDHQDSKTNPKEITQGLAQAYGSMGIVFSEQSNYAKALLFYLKSVKLYEGLNNEIKCSRLYNNIGVVYKSQALDDKALEYFNKSKVLQEKLEDPNVGITLTNIANIYQKQGHYEKALQYYTLAKNSLDTYPNPRALGEWYNNMGLYHKSQKNYEEAILSWKKAITTFEGFDDKFGQSDTYLFLGQLYFEQGQLDKAIDATNKALRLAKIINVLDAQSIAEKLLSDIYGKMNNSDLALIHFKKHSIIKDSLVNEKAIRKSIEASMNYEFEKKELLQKEENEKKELLMQQETKSVQTKFLFGTLILFLLFGIGFLVYNRTQLKKRLTLQKELAEYEQKALHLQMNPHFVFNCLGSISSFIVQNGTDSAIKYLSKFSKLMRLTLEYSKESLIPIDKEMESLQNYLELEQLRFDHGFDFSITKDKDIEDDVALPPLLVQPFVENAIIHGIIPKKNKGLVSVDFSLRDDALMCIIVDDGMGITTSKKNKEHSVVAHRSMALDIIKKRLKMISSSTSQEATVTLNEIKNNGEVRGTKVALKLPLQYLEIRTTVSV